MDLSNIIKITPSKPKQSSGGMSGLSSISSAKSSSMSQNQLLGIGLIVFGVILIGVGILLW